MSSNPSTSTTSPVVIMRWNASAPARASRTLRPFTYSVIMLVDACEMEQPAPANAISEIVSPSRATSRWIWSPQSGFAPSAEQVGVCNGSWFLGRR